MFYTYSAAQALDLSKRNVKMIDEEGSQIYVYIFYLAMFATGVINIRVIVHTTVW